MKILSFLRADVHLTLNQNIITKLGNNSANSLANQREISILQHLTLLSLKLFEVKQIHPLHMGESEQQHPMDRFFNVR